MSLCSHLRDARGRAPAALRTGAALLTAVALLAGPRPAAGGAAAPAAGRVLFPDSIREVPAGAPSSRPHRVRDQLRADELAATMPFAVSLRLRNFAELEARIHSGQTVPQAEMEARYLPLKADFDRVGAWLSAQGFELTLRDSAHTNLFARGSVARLSAALGVAFARVATADGEFTSAVTVPSLPADISGAVLGISGLQPHIRMHVPHPRPSATGSYAGFVIPGDLLAAYNVPGSLDGTGQTIAIIMSAAPVSSDLTTFWTNLGISRGSATYTLINVNGGPTPTYQADAVGEVTLDTEWSTGIATGASLRVYAIPTLSYSDLLAGCTAVLNDGIAKVASYSASGPEFEGSVLFFQPNTQEFALMAAAGITMLSSSGDSGSNPDTGSTNGYESTNTLSVMYPASDPNVTGVGGTTPEFNSSWVMTSEVVWSEIGQYTPPPDPLATGGGVSGLFSKPTWQSGGTLLAGESMRCVPDIASMSSATVNGGGNGGYVYQGGDTGYIGTSLASPLWAGLVAIIDQARANGSQSTLGLLGPFVYPLYGSSSFNAITSGSNGAYSGAAGYNLCTGLGSPNISNMIAQLAAVASVGNTKNGFDALFSATTGSYNVGNGYEALYNNTTGNNNTGVGAYTLYSNVNGNQNVGIGYRTLYANSSGTYNTANGYDALPSNTTGNGNTASGFKSLFTITTGIQNTADGYRALFSSDGQDNAALGWNALQAGTTGTQDSAAGSQALYSDTTGAFNTAMGYGALYSDTTGDENAALGSSALYANTTGSYNSAFGEQALAAATTIASSAPDNNTAVGFQTLAQNTTGEDNAAAGFQALYSNTNGICNAAAGAGALYSNSTGEFVAAVGYQAGYNLTTGGNDVDIGSTGVAGEWGAVRIGSPGVQTKAVIAGIFGATVAAGAVPLYVDSTGTLGTMTSSQRFKTDIRDMGSDSEAVLSLRPVAFRYRSEIDPTGTPQFGLIAEEVQRVSPDLVVNDAERRPYTVRYGAVDVMLLNEFKRQHERIGEQAAVIADQARRAAQEKGAIAALRGQVAALCAAQGRDAVTAAELEAFAARLAALEKSAAGK